MSAVGYVTLLFTFSISFSSVGSTRLTFSHLTRGFIVRPYSEKSEDYGVTDAKMPDQVHT